MRLYTFTLHHPQASDSDGVIATLPASSKQEAQRILSKEFFFNQELVNGYLFEANFLRVADLPEGVAPDKVIRVQTSTGVFEKAFK